MTKNVLTTLKTLIKKRMFSNERYLKTKRQKWKLSDLYKTPASDPVTKAFLDSEIMPAAANIWDSFLQQNCFSRKIEVDDKSKLIRVGQTLNFAQKDSETMRSLLYLNHPITNIEISNTFSGKVQNQPLEYALCCLSADFNPKTNANENIEREWTQKILGFDYLARAGLRYETESI